ncbi:MAG TPA: hypothetical protein VE135_25480 [Pyrinomonadaceae bacterium]|nr:hypothetical protein [Pyrinomonadaceae bacterium]
MNNQKFNWQIWVGFLFSVLSLFSYPLVFVRFPVTRDFPWANLLLFGIAAVFLFVGLRRAFAPQRRARSRIAGVVLTTLSVLVLGLFIFSTFVAARWLPASKGAPQVGQKAPDFSLTDTNGRVVTLSELFSSPINGKAPKGVLLIFYRGYW